MGPLPQADDQAMPTLHYRIDVSRPEAREVEVELRFDLDASGPVVLFLPTWTPGSYLIREHSRHLSRVLAFDADDGAALACDKIAKNRFRVVPRAGTRRARVAWSVSAGELTVRTADVNPEHAFWNHVCLLLWPAERTHLDARLEVRYPPAWELACALPRVGEDHADATTGLHVTTLHGADMDAVYDAPCLIGRLQRMAFEVLGVPHEVVLAGLAGVSMRPTLVADLTAVVAEAARLFGGGLPYARYSFLCLFTADGGGGLEHTDSATLVASRTTIATDKGYREFLSLAAHELLHAWNVKRMRPVEFWRYDYEHENHTGFLWLIEGWTAYYDDLVCRRAGLLSPADYLATVARNVNGMLGAPGRLRLSLAESSYDAWIRLYRPDANTRNSSQNYYGNGAVAAMCLDLVIRRTTEGARSLDDALRTLYSATYGEGRGYTRADVDRAVHDAGGADAVAALRQLVDDRLDPDLEPLLASFGVRLRRQDTDRPHLGVQFQGGGTMVASVTAGSPAAEGGIQPGDELLALQDLRVDAASWGEVLQAVARADAPLEVLLARRGCIRHATVVPRRSPGTIELAVDETAPAAAMRLRDGWMGTAREQHAIVPAT